MKVQHNWLQDYLNSSLPSAEEVANLLTAHAFEIDGVEAVGDESIIDVDVLPNRSSDCLCHRGIAREIATILGIELHYDPLGAAPSLASLPPDQQIKVNIADTHACPRFTASLITGVTVKESPGWLKARLESLGQRSINNIVDATNYVMLAIGQPLHAYDADLFPQTNGTWQFGVRFAREGEQVSLLPEGTKTEERVIDCRGDELLIIDESSDTPIGLAGVKGGAFAGVHAGTKNIIIEAANFDPTIVRKTGRRLGILTDAGKRFENQPAQQLPQYAQYEISKLIKDIADGTYVGSVDVFPEERLNPSVVVRVARANQLLGLSLSASQMETLLRRTGATVEVYTPPHCIEEGDVATSTPTEVAEPQFACTGPFERTDLQIEEDFIEEIGRLHGLTGIESITPEQADTAAVNKKQYYSELVRTALLQAGASEVVTSSFQKKDKIQLQNALASDKSYVRSGLRKNIEKVLDANFVHGDLLGMPVIQVFEIGTVFDKGEATVAEHTALAVGVRSKGTGYTPKDDVPLQILLDTVAETLGVTIEWSIDKGVAEVDFDALIVDLPTPDAYEPFVKTEAKTFSSISPYPAVSRDIALWVQEGITAAMVEDILREQAGELCVRIDLFDEFSKDGRTSYAFRLVFQSKEKTLTDSEVNAVMDRITAVVGEREWEVR